MNEEWILMRSRFRWVIAKCVYSDFLGAGYKFARDGQRVLRFWSKRKAQAVADKLMQANDAGEQ